MMENSKSKTLYYMRNAFLPVEEDMLYEFKGHRNLCIEDLPPWTKETAHKKASRKAVSRNLNAFLNNGKGGIVYIGVIDTGKVQGIKLTEYQKDHVLEALDDLMKRYVPPVKSHRYRVDFVPVVESDTSEEEILKHCANIKRSMRTRSRPQGSLEHQSKPHFLRTHRYCWCDKDALAQYNCGILAGDYVIEICILPWDEFDPRNGTDFCGGVVSLYPHHMDEEGNVYFRKQSSVVQYSKTQMAMLTRQEVKEKCEGEIQRLEEEILRVMQYFKQND